MRLRTRFKKASLHIRRRRAVMPPDEPSSRFSAWIVFSWTRLAIERWRASETPTVRARRLRNWNCSWFGIELCVACVLIATTTQASAAHPWQQTWYCLGTLAFWRINEVVYAFYNDVLSNVRLERARSTLTNADRLAMLARSGFGLVVWFAVLHFTFQADCGIKPRLDSFTDALYFSAVTFTGLGQEGREVGGTIPRFVQVYESLSGVVLLVLAVSIYVSGNRSDA